MLGRIMSGSNAVLAHNEFGQVIGLDYWAPDIHLNHIVEEYCARIAEEIDIEAFVIDREVNSSKTSPVIYVKRMGINLPA